MRAVNLGIYCTSIPFIIVVQNVTHRTSLFNVFASYGSYFIYLIYLSKEKELLITVGFAMLMIIASFPFLFFLSEKDSKEIFLKDQKIKRLIREQKNIMETLPDGLIIYQ
jgi:hypothetical protein